MNNEFRGVPFETLKEMTVGEVKASGSTGLIKVLINGAGYNDN